MSAIASILYGLISGLTEFLPVSSKGHQALLRYMFGAETRIPLQELLVHIGVLLSLLIGCSEILNRLRREQRTHHARSLQKEPSSYYFDLRLLKTAIVPLLIGLCFYFTTAKFENNLLIVMGFWVLNAVILFVADYMPRGNRNAKTMTALDGIAMGIVGALSVLPGISRTGVISSYVIARGTDDENTFHWSVLLGIPAMIFAIIFDFASFFMLGLGVQSFGGMLNALLSGISAFAGGYLGISIFKLILNHSGLSKFAFYSLGAALFTFAIYLIT